MRAARRSTWHAARPDTGPGVAAEQLGVLVQMSTEHMQNEGVGVWSAPGPQQHGSVWGHPLLEQLTQPD